MKRKSSVSGRAIFRLDNRNDFSGKWKKTFSSHFGCKQYSHALSVPHGIDQPQATGPCGTFVYNAFNVCANVEVVKPYFITSGATAAEI